MLLNGNTNLKVAFNVLLVIIFVSFSIVDVFAQTLDNVACGIPAIDQANGRPTILVTGYWPPTNEAVRRFSTDISKNPNGWIGSNWENRGYDIISYFPEFQDPQCSFCGTGYGDLEVDYQDTTNDWWDIVAQHKPIAIITTSRGFNDLSWELEMNQYNRTSWIGDYVFPYQPTPSPPDNSVPGNFLRLSKLPVQDIVDAVNNANIGINSFICFSQDGGGFVSEFIAYLGVWYQSLYDSPMDPSWCIAAGHIHVGQQVSWQAAQDALDISLRTLITNVDQEIILASANLPITDADNDGYCDLLDDCPNFDDALIGTTCDDGSMCTINDVWQNDCVCAGTPTIDSGNNWVSIQLHAYLEGAYDPALGEMRSTLASTRKLLPGQTPTSVLAIPTPAGQPYSAFPWNYPGIEGATWTDANYTGDETDWILVSFRTDIQKNTEVGMTAALLKKDGSISFPNRCVLASTVASPLYIVVEHRNHIGVMTPQPVSVIGNTLTYDFRVADSFRDTTSFGQKQTSTGEWTMYAGDANQSDFPSFDIQGMDKSLWFENNGVFDYYLSPDFNLDGDINGQDKALWFENNGISSRVPK